MSEDKPTLAGDNPWQQDDAEEIPTVMAGQDAEPIKTEVAGGAPFRPTHPSSHQTPAEPTPFPPGFQPVHPGPAPGAERGTEIISAEQAIIPLAWLVVVEGVGGRRGAVKALASETIVGRASGDLILNDPAISGQHLKIKLEALGEDEQAFVLYDMASSNGTYVGGRETYQADESRVYRHVLQDGDFILVGKTTLVFKQV
jgi:hypothetical protein